ncbi:DUF3034 family protein (plasmid) [Trichlorobacter lovleyi]|uniref:DUF3034 family protein n=1 Tax=Trichlorobacter lovleyi TaxID=313985 RepID=UPI00223F0BFE|nr:DUF3034 family protein [Trichlorobacter lovleyi]QOX80972.1 DUF3034 family protein [Trichlorobacter lovleyi]
MMKKMNKIIVAMAVALAATLCGGVAFAGAPFVSLEGYGGIAFNPLAYVAAPADEPGFKAGSVVEIAKPRIGAFYVNLNDKDIDWGTMGIATAINKRVEVSYGYELIAIGGVKNIHKSNVGAKVCVLDENAFGQAWIPAVSVGAVFKQTTGQVVGSDKNGFDAYLVASKTITQTPVPLIFSAGVLTTQGYVNGILGFDNKRKEVFFGNIDVIPVSWLALGFEYKQGPDYGAWKDADYWNVHAGYFVNKNLTLVAAYTNAGDRHNKKLVGLGGGPVVSAQYSF